MNYLLILLTLSLSLSAQQVNVAPLFGCMQGYERVGNECKPALTTQPLVHRPYYPVSISDLAHGKVKHTHVEVTGKVTLAKHEQDGDFHIRISDGQFFIVAECIPELPCQHPKKGDTVTVRGISRFDGEHRWFEVHPVEELWYPDRTMTVQP